MASLDAPDLGPVLGECPDAYSTVTVHSGQIVILERFRGPDVRRMSMASERDQNRQPNLNGGDRGLLNRVEAIYPCFTSDKWL